MKEFEWVKLSDRLPEVCHLVDGRISIRYVLFEQWRMDFASLSLLHALPRSVEIEWLDNFPFADKRVGAVRRFLSKENMPSKSFVFHVDITDPKPSDGAAPASPEVVNAIKEKLMPYDDMHSGSGLKIGDSVKGKGDQVVLKRIADVDNFDGEGPGSSEAFLPIPPLPEDEARIVADIINRAAGHDSSRYYKVVDLDYRLWKFEP